jgi:hypothetical protein
MEVITESRKKRRNHPKKPVNNSMGDHEDDHENPTRLVLRRRYSHMLRQENRKTGIYVFAVGAAILFNVSVVLHGQVGWMPRLAGGEESRPYNHTFISRKPRPVGGELHFFSAFLEAINVPPHSLFSPF